MNSIDCIISWNSSHFGLPEFSTLIFSVQEDCLVYPFLCCGLQKSLQEVHEDSHRTSLLFSFSQGFFPLLCLFSNVVLLIFSSFSFVEAAKVNLVLVTPSWSEWKSISVFSF